MLFLKGPEGRRKATAGRKENGELPLGRAGAGRRAGSARRTFLFARAGIGGHRPGWVGGRFRPGCWRVPTVGALSSARRRCRLAHEQQHPAGPAVDPPSGLGD